MSANLAKMRPAQVSDPAMILGALPDPILLVSEDNSIRFANPAAEQFFQNSASLLVRQKLQDIVPFGSPLLALVTQVQSEAYVVSEYNVDLGSPRIGERWVDIQVSPVPESPGHVLIKLDERGMAHKIDKQLTSRGAARSVTAMAAVLAHEVKNPLSGIRGAAQLLESSVPEQDRGLTRLICDEADRICDLVDRMEVFSDKRPIVRGPVNIHRVLEHVRKVAHAGFGRNVRFIERYDPSLPPVFGNRDQLVQVFLNLVKNACEACPDKGGEVVLTTGYRHGVRLAVRGTGDRLRLPLEVTVQDNGSGVPEDIAQHMFDAFVTTKPTGTGLGLALVAKIVGDHGGVIECDSRPRRTVFNVRLPVIESGEEPILEQNIK